MAQSGPERLSACPVDAVAGIDQEDRRAGPIDRALHPRPSRLDFPCDPEHGFRLDLFRRIRRQTDEGRHPGEAQQPADRHRPVHLHALPERRLDPLQGQRRLLPWQAVGRPADLRHHPGCQRAPAEVAPQRVPDCPVAQAPGRAIGAEGTQPESGKDGRIHDRVRRHQQPASTAGQA
ncbi:hypothetical protein D3C87_1399550 [compost metagenome]